MPDPIQPEQPRREFKYYSGNFIIRLTTIQMFYSIKLSHFRFFFLYCQSPIYPILSYPILSYLIPSMSHSRKHSCWCNDLDLYSSIASVSWQRYLFSATPSRKMPGENLHQATNISFQIISNSSFTNHPIFLRHIVCGTDSIVKKQLRTGKRNSSWNRT
jgi:hypothetical protein